MAQTTDTIPIQPLHLEIEDLKDPDRFHAFQDWMQKVTDFCNVAQGIGGGPIPIHGPLDLQGNAITNVGKVGGSGTSTDALTAETATPNFGPSAIQSALEAGGTNTLQTTRRLNDQNQRELHTTFLKSVPAVAPCTTNTTISVTDNGDGTSQINVTADKMTFGDSSVSAFAARSDRVTNPGAGSRFYFYYWRALDSTVQFVGPFTSNVPFNQFGALLDGNDMFATAQVNAGGGGSGTRRTYG